MNKQNQVNFPKKPELLIVGASTRAAAFSALRAGFQAVCVDQYADQDLHEIAEVIPKTDACSDWIDTLSKRRSLEWIYTGAMENHPELIEQISQQHQLRGCGPKILECARDPFFLQQILSKNSIQAASCLPSGSLLKGTEKWLSKPFKGAAGNGIRFVDSNSSTASLKEHYYLQRYQPGIPLSALFISFHQITILVGIALQFSGNPAFNAAPFQFCGGVTLSPVAHWLKNPIEEMGQTISRHCQIRGIFGCDFVLNPAEENALWLNEVNPRYTALTELFELQNQLPLLHWHLAACRSFEESQTGKNGPEALKIQLLHSEKRQTPQISKGILYAAREIKSPKIDWKHFCTEDRYQIPEIADIPRSGMRISTGSPICTVYGVGENLHSCLQSLTDRMVDYEQLFDPDRCSSNAFITSLPIQNIEKLFF
ncbi:MAG: ATP-grasp domain-containing protein [Gimesia sp.]